MKFAKLLCNAEEMPVMVENDLYFSWQVTAEDAGYGQTAYQVQVMQGATAQTSLLWDSGKVQSDRSIYAQYTGPALKPNSRYCWRVRVWDEDDAVWEYSEYAFFETGLFDGAWKADWIGYDEGEEYDKSIPFYCADDFEEGENTYYLPPPPYLRKEFAVAGSVNRARLFVSAFGLAEVSINGEAMQGAHFVPGLSNYPTTVFYRVFDVTALIQEGQNAIGAILADGWYAGYMGLTSREWYGSKPRLALQLEIEYADGKTQTVLTDRSWKAAYGPLQESDIFEGETYDARKELKGWDAPRYDDGEWAAVQSGAKYSLTPTAHPGVPVVEHQRYSPIKQWQTTTGNFIFDFGKNIAGVVALQLQMQKGQQLVIRHAEMLDAEGNLYLRGNRSARSMDSYIAKGEETEAFFPRFTYHGFRYAEIAGVTAKQIRKIQAVAISSATVQQTKFECSSPVINNALEMIQNTRRSNQFEMPTDCCARDERIGWGMEGNHFLYAMTYLSNQQAFMRKWAADIWEAQREDGALEATAPPVMMKDIQPFVGDLQSNHGMYMLHALYRMYGDASLFEKYFDKAVQYFAFLEKNSDRHIRTAISCDWLGIWEETGHSDLNHGYGDCMPGIIGTAHYAIAVCMMQDMCHWSGRQELAQQYKNLYQEIRSAFRVHFVQRNGILRSQKQGDLLMAIFCGFFTPQEEEKNLAILTQKLLQQGNVRWNGGTPTTPFFLRTLYQKNRADIANQFFSSKQYPSLGYMMEKGATAVWERWDAIYEDGTIHPQVMNALNHIGFTVAGEYLVSGLAGIDCLLPGFKKIQIAPAVKPGVDWVNCQFASPHGDICSNWQYKQGVFAIQVQIPANTTATVIIPANSGGNIQIMQGEPLSVKEIPDGYELEVKGGSFYIQSEYTRV